MSVPLTSQGGCEKFPIMKMAYRFQVLHDGRADHSNAPWEPANTGTHNKLGFLKSVTVILWKEFDSWDC